MIFGLRQTRNIENLLYDSSKYGVEDPAEAQSRQVHELLPQPLSQTGDPLLFPFLVLESKSGVSGTDWHSIHLQTAFTLRTLIQAQRKLRITGPDMARRPLTPLVWFLCNKGEDWKLSIAFTEEPSSENPRGETFNCVRPCTLRLLFSRILIINRRSSMFGGDRLRHSMEPFNCF